ncbi:MAG: hypothetical protein L3J79_04260 [Candidatus Marinimicrobia bacterium]|nr:hypothetical protein [Candidatus Neomarinimicrobiota bacterium]
MRLFLIFVGLIVLPDHLAAGSDPVNQDTIITVDSVHLSIDGDTLVFKKTWSIDFPQYSPGIDSIIMPDQHSSSTLQTDPENGLQATGSIRRGIQVSSNASVSLQSSMYLKIKGNLSEDYLVSGVLTEKTSPLQPIGNTRRLNDFDRVLVNVTGPALSASIGDIDLKLDHGRFGQLERSMEGIDMTASRGRTSIRTSVGFSYGKYHLLQLQGKDGKQGPYRLSGKNGEKFIIVLAGSERVKLNDKLLQRGADDDYIIDYNAAEITFTQRYILSNNSRISVEFEYVPDIYLASYSFGKQLVSGGFSVGEEADLPFYITASWQNLRDDAGNPLGDVDLEQLETVFNNLPDSVQSQWVSTIKGDYKLNESRILVYGGEGLGNHYVGFNFVGLATGEYRKELNASGSFFIYDTLQGEYLPAKRYFSPQSRTVFSIKGGAALGILHLDIDLGLSQNIKNLYASQFNSQRKQGRDVRLSSRGRYLELMLGDKYYESGFVTHAALESIEYYRLWQIAPRISEAEHLNFGELRLGELKHNFISGKMSRLSRAGELVGQQMQVEAASSQDNPLHVNINSSLTKRDSSVSQQHALLASLTTAKVLTEVLVSLEDRQRSMLYPSNDHLRAGGGITYSWTKDHKLALRYEQRLDYRLDQGAGSFLDKTRIESWSDQRQDWTAAYSFSEFKNTNGNFQFKYREQETAENSLTKYYLGNFEFSGTALDKRIRYNQYYVVDEEHIPKYDYNYLEVDTGYGNYSFDPYINDYILISGGRFIRQRVFSDVEEQVRKYENRTRF